MHKNLIKKNKGVTNFALVTPPSTSLFIFLLYYYLTGTPKLFIVDLYTFGISL